jgi:hypothetical protein
MAASDGARVADDRITFAQASAKDFPGKDYDLVAFFDCLHDMGDPVGAGKHVKETLAKDGSWMIVEPFAHDNLKDNLNPVGCIFYHASTFICTPASLSQDVALGLGAQAGEGRLRQVVTESGFKRFRRATETPFNMIFDVRTSSVKATVRIGSDTASSALTGLHSLPTDVADCAGFWTPP